VVRAACRRHARRHHARAGAPRRGTRRLQARRREGRSAQPRQIRGRDQAERPRRHAMRRAFAALALAFALAGCGTSNPLRWIGLMDPLPNQPTPLKEIQATVTPRAVWTASVGKAGGFRFRPDAEGGRIYVASADGVVTVLDESGKVVSRH